MMKMTLMLLLLIFPVHLIAEELQGENLLFSPPDGYQIGYTNNNNDIYIQEWIPDGQNIKDWSEMLTIQVLFNYPIGDLDYFVNKFIGMIVAVCEDGRGLTITDGAEYGYLFNYFMTICGKNPNTQKPEFTMVKAISGNDALYIVQKAWRYEPTDIQMQDWSNLVSQVFLCDTRNKSAPCPKV